MTSSDIPRPSHYAGNHPGGYVHPQQPVPPRKRTGRTVLITLLIISAGAVLCAAGATALIGGAGTAVKHTSVSRFNDITVNGCEKTIIDTVEITYTAVNSGNATAHYFPRFDIRDAAGAVIGTATDFSPAVPAGGTFKGKAIGVLNTDAAGFSCVLTGA